MLKVRLKRSGMGVIEIIIIVAVVFLIGGGVWYALYGSRKPMEAPAPVSEEKQEQKLIWQQTETGWQPSQTPPDCPAQPIMKMPTDIGKVTSVLYPGQRRGGDYKPHGGFRMDTSSSAAITVVSPTDGFVVRGSRYLEKGEVQYSFDAINNCGVMYRVDHIREPSATLRAIAEKWPEPTEGGSQSQVVEPAVYIAQGETLATAVGFTRTKNTFFDWGVYDLRSPNEASKSPSYQAAHQQDKEQAWYAVCWFDWLPEADEKIIRSLPSADPASGKISDYCR